jgi:hypothetical protein
MPPNNRINNNLLIMYLIKINAECGKVKIRKTSPNSQISKFPNLKMPSFE